MAYPSLPGGTADKVANLYEEAWTVDSLLDLIAGDIEELHLEPQGEDGLGVEFYRVLPSRESEYHSVKRQVPGALSGWTAAVLVHPDSGSRRSILGDLFEHLERSDLARAVFVSQDSARSMRELSERARAAANLDEFRRQLPADLQKALGRILDGPTQGEADAYEKLRRSEFKAIEHRELLRFVEQRIPALVQQVDGRPPDAGEVRRCLGEFAGQNFRQVLTSAEVLAKLQEQGFTQQPLAKSVQVQLAISDRNGAYLRRSQKTLINGAHIPRSQAAAIAEKLTIGQHSLLLAGSAGEGKTCLLAQVIGHLEEADVPHLALSMDELEGIFSPAVLGRGMGLPASPAVVLGQISAGRRAVLCIDQLDATSFVSGRNAQGQKLLDELVMQVSRYPQMLMLLACRSFDLDMDDSLSALVRGDLPTAHRVDVEILSIKDVYGALATAGIGESELANSEIELLRTPLHLHLLLGAGPSRTRFGSRQDLFDRYWDEKRRRVDQLVGSGAFVNAVAALSNLLGTRERTQVPMDELTDHESALDAMASEAVIFTQDRSVRFFHESFFHYVLARKFLRRSSDLAEWLTGGEQPLSRRSQVREVLSLLRERDADRDRYLQTLEKLLTDERVRFHIRKLVLDWLGALPDPTCDEWDVLKGLPEELDAHVWNAISNSVAWFDVLHERGYFLSWLAADDEQIDRTVTLLQTPDVLGARAAEVARLVHPFLGKSDAWRERLWWIARRERSYESPEMQSLLTDLVADGTLGDAVSGTATDRNLWFVLHRLSTEAPEFTARVLGTWFDRQVERASELARDDPFPEELESATDIQSGEHVIEQCSKLAPLEFVRELYPRLIRLDRALPPQVTYGPGTQGGGLHQKLREALAQAMSCLALADPERLNSIMAAASPEEDSWTEWRSALVLRSWSANPELYAERIVSFLLERPEERLQLSYDVYTRHTDPYAGISGSAVGAAGQVCSEESFTELESAILKLTSVHQYEHRVIERTQLALLWRLPEERRSEIARRRTQELERKFNEAPAPATSEPPEDEGSLVSVGSPIPPEARSLARDAHWLGAMAKYASDGLTWRGQEVLGGSRELSQELEVATRGDPERFASLVEQMDSSYAPVYFEAILRGLTGGEAGADRVGTLAQACAVLRRIRQLGIEVRGWEVAQAVRALAAEDLPDDIIEMLCHVALEAPDPAADTWQEPDSSWGAPGTEAINQAINSSRGAAAVALAQLLYTNRERWSSLKVTVTGLVADPVLAVRSVAVECLTAVLHSHQEEALSYFHRLVEGADAILETRHIERFVRSATSLDYAAVRPVLQSMLQSARPATVRVGARETVVAALRGDSRAQEDEERVFGMGQVAKAAAAEVYAENLADETVGAHCETKLEALFDDEGQPVRQAASRCWGALPPDQLALKGPLIGVFARSHAFDQHSAGTLAHHLERAQQPPPVEVCDLAERAVAEFGDKVTSIQFEEAFVATELSKLVTRLLAETDDRTLRKRILDVIDDMQRARFLGIDEQLKAQDGT
ncbi:MAG: hypothetical protein OXS47_02555 [Chloroflexota bacterium]|nr:hypothetical protein [Chloroflexota bacterium]